MKTVQLLRQEMEYLVELLEIEKNKPEPNHMAVELHADFTEILGMKPREARDEG